MGRHWRLVVEETFMLTGRGLVAVGLVEGEARQGDRAGVRTPDSSVDVAQISFDICGGPRSGLLLPGLSKDQVPRGAVVEGQGST